MFGLTNPEIALMMMGIFLFLVLLGFPIAFTLLAMGVAFGYYAYYNPETMNTIFDNRVFDLVVQNTYTVMDNQCFDSCPIIFIYGIHS
jgi:TRAP-type mannitol/chloroaromatic compound transport system permease large subunit